MARNSILVLGSSNTDMVIRVKRIPKSGETVLGGEFTSAAGGKGANQAVGAARAGGKVTFIARVGKDVLGETAISQFIAEGINVDFIVRDPQSPSGVALIFVGQDGENSIAVASGANGRLAPADVKKAGPVLRNASVLVLQLETPLKTVEMAAEIAAKAGVRVILNPAPAQVLPNSLLAHVYVLTPNESEAELLTGLKVTNEADAAKAAEKLLASGVQNVILTMGARGAFVAGKNVRQLIPGHQMKAVDTIAAGDVFNGALAVALAEGKSLLDAAQFANAAAAISVTRAGAQTSAPTRKEIEQLLSASRAWQGKSRSNLSKRNGHALQLNHNGSA
ncbi:MAG: Ribokinase [Pedosphaera sp.]|nr:Ribokinase [Pedosphaera sp.]